MCRITIFFLLATLLCAQGAAVLSAEANEDDQLLTDIRLFTVLTAINVAGYDTGFGSPSDSAVRRVVRGDLKDFRGPSLTRLKNFYQQNLQNDPVSNLSQYITFALTCGEPPTFDVTANLPTDLPPSVQRLRALSPILSEFYSEADIEELWNRYQPAYDNEIARYQESLIGMLLQTGSYLRFSPTSQQTRSFKIYFSLMGAPNQVTSRSNHGEIHVVLPASTNLRLDEIRQAFLMHLLDPMSIRYAEDVAKKEVLARSALFAPALSETYKTNFQLLVSKSLANAIEVRLSDAADGDKQTRVGQFLKQGFILTLYFYEKLVEYEAQPEAFSRYYRKLIQQIDLKDEAKRLQGIEFVAPPEKPASSPVRPKISELDRLLNEAEGYFRLEDLEQSRAKFEEALVEAGGRNAQAEYGLARVAAFEGEPDLAREYFEKAIVSTDDKHIRAMSHVYIARIEDLVGNREQAVEHYQLALAVGDSSPRVRELAEGGLKEAFGVGPDAEEEKQDQ